MSFQTGRRTGIRPILAAALLTLLAAAPVFAAQTHFYFDDPGGRNLVQFRSKAPLETIVGTTNGISGHISVDTDDVSKLSGRLVVDLAGFDTGIGLRNEHMRDQYLHTGKYPEAVLEIRKATPKGDKKLQDGKTVQVEVEGNLTLHGVTKKVKVLAEVTYLGENEQTKARIPGNLINVNAEFQVKLTDFNIERPKMVILKVADEVKLTIEAVATTTQPQMAMNPCGGKAAAAGANPCNPCGGKGANPCGGKGHDGV